MLNRSIITLNHKINKVVHHFNLATTRHVLKLTRLVVTSTSSIKVHETELADNNIRTIGISGRFFSIPSLNENTRE